MIIPMSLDYAKQISGWTYENEYSVYSFDQNQDALDELINGDYFVCLDKNNEIIGYFCFGKSAQIPTTEKDVYNNEMLDIGLGMKPNLCGKSNGYSFVKEGIEFFKSNFDNKQIRLTVAEFNTRAIRVYEKIGFKYSLGITHIKTQKKFWIMIYKY